MMEETQGKRAETILKLLAKAEDKAATPEEAEAFTAKAAALQAKWAIDDAMLAAAGKKSDMSIESRTIQAHGIYHAGLIDLGAQVGWARGFKVLQGGYKTKRYFTWIGAKYDLDAAEMLYTSLVIQQANDTKRFMKAWKQGDGIGATNFERFNAQRSYMRGYASGVGEALRRAQREAEEAATQEHGTGVGLVLASKQDAIERYVEQAYPNLRASRDRSRTDWAAANKGTRDGRNADTGARARVSGSSPKGALR